MFSKFSAYLKGHDAITMQDLSISLRSSYSPSPLVSEIDKVCQFKQILEEKKVLRHITGHPQPLSFKFELSDEVAVMSYKNYSSDNDWLSQANRDEMKIFNNDSEINFENIKSSCPDETKEDVIKQIILCLKSNLSRINNIDESKIPMLEDELDKIINPTRNEFHWDTSLYENNEEDNEESENGIDEDIESEKEMEVDQEVNRIHIGSVQEKLDFSIGNYVAVNTEEPNEPFWQKLLEIHLEQEFTHQ